MKRTLNRTRGTPLLGLLFISAALALSCALPAGPADRFAIVIGITDYADSALPDPQNHSLTWPAADAVSMTSLLESRGWIVDSTLTDSLANRGSIESKIKALASRLDSNSSVLVYYSGHGAGLPAFDQAYIVPYDGITPSGGLDESKWIASSDIETWMSGFPCANRLLILDSCNSGGFVETANSVDSAPPNYGSTLPPFSGYQPSDGGFGTSLVGTALAKAGDLLRRAVGPSSSQSILTIAAAGSEEQSYDGETSPGGIAYGHGVFTYYLLRAGSDSAADRDSNKLVTAIEAYTYAKNMIVANWNAAYGNSYDFQGDMYEDFLPRVSGGSGDIVLYDLR